MKRVTKYFQLSVLYLLSIFVWQEMAQIQQSWSRGLNFSQYHSSLRYYDSKKAQFISPDTLIPGNYAIPLGLNRYLYVFGNPFKYNDPSGHVPQDPSQKNHIVPFISTPNPFLRRHMSPMDEINNLIGQFDPSRGFIRSDIVVLNTPAALTLIAQMQEVIGDQGTLFGVPERNSKLRFMVNGERTGTYDFFVLAMQSAKNPRPDSPSYKLSKRLEGLFDLTTKNKTPDDRLPAASLFAGDGQVNPLFAQGSGGRTYVSLFSNGSSSSAIFLDTNSQSTHLAHQGPRFKIPLGVTAFHELFHAENLLERKRLRHDHNTLEDDLRGEYDEAFKLDNELIFPAYNENHPNNPLPDRAHYTREWTPQARKFLFHDIIFGQSKSKEKKE